jgi:uncharacterized protein
MDAGGPPRAAHDESQGARGASQSPPSATVVPRSPDASIQLGSAISRLRGGRPTQAARLRGNNAHVGAHACVPTAPLASGFRAPALTIAAKNASNVVAGTSETQHADTAAMRLVVDITHPCDISFFKAPIRRWRQDGHEVRLVYLDRGAVPRLVRHEYPDLAATKVGKHAAGRLGLYLRTGLWRELELLRALRGEGIDAVVGFPGFQTALVAKPLGIKSLGAYDDAEHRPNLVLAQLLCDVLVLPEQLGITGGNIQTCRALKEWAYLAPSYFSPNPAVLTEYGLKSKSYVFVREIEPRSLNYRGPKDAVPIVELLYRAGLNRHAVVLSLEDKRRRHLYDGWRILEEPVSDIHSLMYYSALVLSSGDSMAREGAQLGVPSVYLGERQMKANDALYGMGLMHQITSPAELMARLDELAGGALGRAGYELVITASAQQERARADIAATWEDPVEVLTTALYSLHGEPSPRGVS